MLHSLFFLSLALNHLQFNLFPKMHSYSEETEYTGSPSVEGIHLGSFDRHWSNTCIHHRSQTTSKHFRSLYTPRLPPALGTAQSATTSVKSATTSVKSPRRVTALSPTPNRAWTLLLLLEMDFAITSKRHLIYCIYFWIHVFWLVYGDRDNCSSVCS